MVFVCVAFIIKYTRLQGDPQMDHKMDHKKIAPSANKNKQPIASVLKGWLPQKGNVLEVASGTGQHVVHFAEQFPHLVFFPTEYTQDNINSIMAYAGDARRGRVRPPQMLDVCQEGWANYWRLHSPEVIICINMLHIVPWQTVEGLLSGAGRLLKENGLLYLYGPFKVDGQHVAPSNEIFDQQLRKTNAAYGVRDIATIRTEAMRHGLHLAADIDMPSHNKSLIFRKRTIAG
jgi:SAM-dependent methyltransferase